MAKGVKTVGTVGVILALTEPIIWVIDRVGEVDVVSDHLGQLGPFLNSGWGTLVTVLGGCALIAWAVYRALFEKSGEGSQGDGTNKLNSGAIAGRDNTGTQNVYNAPIIHNYGPTPQPQSPLDRVLLPLAYPRIGAALNPISPGDVIHGKRERGPLTDEKISVQDAMMYIVNRSWPDPDTKLQDGQSDNALDALHGLREAAHEGKLTIFGFEHNGQLPVAIEPDFWVMNQIHYLSAVFAEKLETVHSEPATYKATNREFRGLQVKKSEVETLWSPR